jgi:predicted nucleic acid-binding protein
VIVVDASAVVHLLTASPVQPLLLQDFAAAGSVHAPYVLDFEVAHTLRGLLLGKKIEATIAEAARAEFARIQISHYPMATLEERVWELRGNFTAYDASYIALAEALECPLLTRDAKLVAPSLHAADVRCHR